MKYKKGSYWKWIIPILWILFLYIAIYSIEYQEDAEVAMKTRTLEKDGFCVLYDTRYLSGGDSLIHPILEKDVLSRLPSGYIFLNYSYSIYDGTLSTFHRDVTSSQRIYKTIHPVYTVILYKYSGQLLSLCPGSHATYPFVVSPIVNIDGPAGSAFLFDCDVLHAGRKNGCSEREVVQYKVCHHSDLSKMAHLKGVRAIKREQCEESLYQTTIRKASYFLEMPVNTVLYPILIQREDDRTLVGAIQSLSPITYYNNV